MSNRSDHLGPHGPAIVLRWIGPLLAAAGLLLAVLLLAGLGPPRLLAVLLAILAVAGGLVIVWARAQAGAAARVGASSLIADPDLLAAILDQLGEGVAVADTDGHLVLFNEEAERILGLGRVDSGPEQWSEYYGLFRPDGKTPMPVEDLPLSLAVRGKASRDVELYVRNPRRTGLFIRVTARPLRDRDGKVTGGVAVFRDISERKWKDALLRDREVRFRSIVEAASSALVILSPTGIISDFNPEAERVFGRSRAEALGRDFAELCFPEEFREAVAADIRRAAAGEETDDFETPVSTGDRRARTVLWTLGRWAGIEGQSDALVATGHDVTARREANEARRMRELAAHLELAREGERKHLAREIHDELGQALTGLKLQVSSLSRKTLADPEVGRRLGEFMATIDETIEVVRRVARELRPPMLDDLGLVEAIRLHGEEFQARSGVRCTLSLPSGRIECDSDCEMALYRIAQEALTNVARHARASSVSVRLESDDDRLVLEIEDDGRGIPTDAMENTRSFGLIGMRERARMFGGALDVSPGREKGTIVRVELPGREGRSAWS